MKVNTLFFVLAVIVAALLTPILVAAGPTLAQAALEPPPLSSFDQLVDVLTNAIAPYVAYAAPLGVVLLQLLKRSILKDAPPRAFGYLNLLYNAVFATVTIFAYQSGRGHEAEALVEQLAELIPILVAAITGGSLATAGIYHAAKVTNVPLLGYARTNR